MPEIVRCGTYYFHLNVLTDFFFSFLCVYSTHRSVCQYGYRLYVYVFECIKGIGRYMNRCAHCLFMHPVT